MADSLTDFADDSGPAIDSQNSLIEFSDFPQTLVTEKIIFCIDILALSSEDETLMQTMYVLLKSYFTVKTKISAKPPEFECLIIIDNDTIVHSYINTIKDLHASLACVQTFEYEEEKEPLEIDKVFNKIAEIVELPDPDCYKKCLPPPWVYHVIWLFGRNFYIPTMQNTNSFDFLMMTPYFALDILYLHDSSLENNKCEQISQSLVGLNENGKGYYLSVKLNVKAKLISCLSQFLGHPLIRLPQINAKYNILDLGPQSEEVSKNNDEI